MLAKDALAVMKALKNKYNVLKEKLNVNLSELPFFWNTKYIRKTNKELLPLINAD